MAVAEEARALAGRHGVIVSNDYPEQLASQFSRIEGVEGDETLELLADLKRLGKISPGEFNDLLLRHVREKPSAGS